MRAPFPQLIEFSGRLGLWPPRFYAIVFTVLAAQLLIQLLLFPAMGGDSAEQLLFAQSLQGGYGFTNPPLFTWLTILVQLVVGPTGLAVLIVKYALLSLAYLCLLGAARLTIRDPAFAALAALSPFAIYLIGWDTIVGYSHSVALIAFLAATLLALLRLDRNVRLQDYALLGVAIGLGLLTKYNFTIALLGLLVAALFESRYRQRLLHPYFLVTVILALLIFLPHGLWILGHLDALESVYTAKFYSSKPILDLPNVASGIVSAIGNGFGFLLPLLLFLLLLFPRTFIERAGHRLTPAARVLGNGFIIVAILTLAAVLVGQVARFRAHYMFVLAPLPLYLFARIEVLDRAVVKRQALALLVGLCVLVTLVALPVKFAIDPWRKPKHAYLNVPYETLAAQIRGLGFTRGTIVADWHPYVLGGNMKVQFPESRVLSTKHPDFVPELSTGPSGQCLVTWVSSFGNHRRSAMLIVANQMVQVDPNDGAREGVLLAPLVPTRDRLVKLSFFYFPLGSGTCR